MIDKLKLYSRGQGGQLFLLAIIVLTLVMVNTVIFISQTLLFSQNSKYSLDSLEALNLAEAGIDKAVASLNATGGQYIGENETFLGNGSYTVTVTPKDQSTNIIQSTGYIPNKTDPKVTRTIKIQVSKGNGISFVYGMLVGNGGITMGNGARINGSVYSNGNINGGNNERITGDVYIAGGTQPSADQTSECSDPNCGEFVFGKDVGSNSPRDVAQSFKPTQSTTLNKVSLRLKKAGTPANPSVKVLPDSSGEPDKNNVLASGTLSANLVTNEFGFVDVSFDISPQVTAGTTYWIMVVPQALDSTNYWVWSEDTLQSYTNGSAKWTKNWQTGNPVWNSIPADLGFKTWMGGVPTYITMNNGSVIEGNVHANTINGITINKDAYYQVLTNSVVGGTSYPNSADPPPEPMPISEANIAEWKQDAENLGESTGDVIGCPETMGPGKIIGNVTTGNNCTIVVRTPIWITGNLNFGNMAIFQMHPSHGNSSGVIIVDGQTVFQNSDNLLGTGATGSYLTLLSTYDSPANANQVAINTGNSSITGILYAPFGIITLANSATFKEAVAWQIDMGTSTVLTYDSGLINTFFSAGPSGAFTVINGTYQAD
jgi:hypothetical protein